MTDPEQQARDIDVLPAAFAREYVLSTEGADYEPTEFERGLIEDALRGFIADHWLAFRAAQTGEIERLRSALVACGRHAGALLADEVSTGLLMHVPEEVRMKLAALPSDDGAREVGVIPPDVLPYLQGARQALERRKQRYPDDWQLGAFGVGYDLLDYLLSCAALSTQGEASDG